MAAAAAAAALARRPRRALCVDGPPGLLSDTVAVWLAADYDRRGVSKVVHLGGCSAEARFADIAFIEHQPGGSRLLRHMQANAEAGLLPPGASGKIVGCMLLRRPAYTHEDHRACTLPHECQEAAWLGHPFLFFSTWLQC